MTSPVALIDATAHDDTVPADLEVAGLGLVERTLRLAAVSECRHAVVVYRTDRAAPVADACDGFADDDRYNMSVERLGVEETEDIVEALAGHLGDRLRPEATLLTLDSTRVYERGPAQQLVDTHGAGDGISVLPGEAIADPAVLDGHTWHRLADLSPEGPTALTESLIARADRGHTQVRPADDLEAGWRVAIDGPAAAERAGERIWQGCIKPIDGPISRHLNRKISLAISRRLAPTAVTPNHMSIVTFAFGIAATIAVAGGGYAWFLAGAILYQLSSILDGVDGELARGKYEFSLFGEWIDTLCDNTKDILFYLGLGYGASQTVPGLLGFAGADLWMWLGTLAATGKFLSLAGYATWLIPRDRGCPGHFDWGDDGDGKPADGLVARAVSHLEVLGKNDVVLFSAFVLAVVGGLHWFLLLMAVGHHVVAGSVVARLASPEVDIVPEHSREPEPEPEPLKAEN
ncbi:MAG: CDP-alcohol phosphatidyltransferase family protein [Bradymonadaceae bacterium]